MNCPKCNSVIPDDSKFCPDCGTVIKNIDSLRKEAAAIYHNYKKGYEYFANIGSVPHFSDFLSIEGYELILSKKNQIIAKNTSIIESEQRQKELERQKQAEATNKARILGKLRNLNITDQEAINMFLEHPERLNDQHWINWGKDSVGKKRSSSSHTTMKYVLAVILCYTIEGVLLMNHAFEGIDSGLITMGLFIILLILPPFICSKIFLKF